MRCPRRRDLRLRGRAAALLAAALLPIGCGPTGAPPRQPILTWTLEPPRPSVGPATLSVVLRDSAGMPLTGARVTAEGHMSHPGMAPVLAAGAERGAGRYDVPLSFTMAGDWVVMVAAVLPDGVRVERRVDVSVGQQE